MDIPECCICYEGVNDSTRRPRSLPCGHTICTVCIDKFIEKGDRTCPSCRQPHHVADSSKLPINFALEEVFQKCTDVRQNKENIIKETRDSIYSFETSVLELQNEVSMKERLIVNNQAQLDQKLAKMECLKRDMECLKKDIQEDKKAKQGLDGSIADLEENIRFLENSVQNIRISKTSNAVINIYEDVKRKLKMSTLHQHDARKKAFQASEETLQSRTVSFFKTDGKLGINWTGGSDYGLPIIIVGTNPGTAAFRHGIKSDDHLLSVNGISTDGLNHKDTFELIQNTTENVTLEVRNTPGAVDESRKRLRALGHEISF